MQTFKLFVPVMLMLLFGGCASTIQPPQYTVITGGKSTAPAKAIPVDDGWEFQFPKQYVRKVAITHEGDLTQLALYAKTEGRWKSIKSTGSSPEIPLNLTTDRSAVTLFNNVFNPLRGGKTTIRFDITSPGRVTMRLYTRTGRHIKTLIDTEQAAGKGAVDWFGRNFNGSTVASGIYLLTIEAPGIRETKKIAIVK